MFYILYKLQNNKKKNEKILKFTFLFSVNIFVYIKTIKICHLESVHLLSHRCSSPWLTPLDGLPPTADLLIHVAGDTAEKRQAVRQSGGVCHHGDTDGPRAHELQADSAAPPGSESKGMKMLLVSQLVFKLQPQYQ